MKRLIPAVIILLLITGICICANISVNSACDKTVDDLKSFYDKDITASQLENRWKERKEKMSLFVNHGFLDKISVYIGQITIAEKHSNSYDFDKVYQNIESVLSLIKAEQKPALHSLY